jgi:hypothetical protein
MAVLSTLNSAKYTEHTTNLSNKRRRLAEISEKDLVKIIYNHCQWFLGVISGDEAIQSEALAELSAIYGEDITPPDIISTNLLTADELAAINGAASPSALNVFATMNDVNASGSTTINNNANNRLITGSDTANTLEGEVNATFDGNTLLFAANANKTIGVAAGAGDGVDFILSGSSGSNSAPFYDAGQFLIYAGNGGGGASSGIGGDGGLMRIRAGLGGSIPGNGTGGAGGAAQFSAGGGGTQAGGNGTGGNGGSLTLNAGAGGTGVNGNGNGGDVYIYPGTGAHSGHTYVGNNGTTDIGSTRFGSGSVGAPGITFRADTNTGLFSAGDDILGVSAGGAEIMRFTNADIRIPIGKIPTGTPSGTEFLFVDGSDNDIIKRAAISKVFSAALFINNIAAPADNTDYGFKIHPGLPATSTLGGKLGLPFTTGVLEYVQICILVNSETVGTTENIALKVSANGGETFTTIGNISVGAAEKFFSFDTSIALTSGSVIFKITTPAWATNPQNLSIRLDALIHY